MNTRFSGVVSQKQANETLVEVIETEPMAIQDLAKREYVIKMTDLSINPSLANKFAENKMQDIANAVDNGGVNDYNDNRGESYARTDEFRRLQAEVQGMSDETTKMYRTGQQSIDDGLREDISNIFRSQINAARNGVRNGDGLLNLTDSRTGNKFNIYQNVNGELFHDIFEITRSYLRNGELVDLHEVNSSEDGIGYNDCYNYLSEDGLSGFSITPDGDLISVFNLSATKGFLYAIKDIIKNKARTLDCYNSEVQPLQCIYTKVFGFKTASVMDYNMEYNHDDIAQNHGSPQVAFMVNTEQEVETKSFTQDQYDEAKAYRDSFVETQADLTESASFMPENALTDDFSQDFEGDPQTDAANPENDLQDDFSQDFEGDEAVDSIESPTRHHLNLREQNLVKDLCERLGIKLVFENKVNVAKANGRDWQTIPDAWIDENNVIHMNFAIVDPIGFVIKHELTHFAEGSYLYSNFVEAVKESKVFEEWISEKIKGDGSIPAKTAKYRQSIIDRYAKNGIELSPTKAETEIIANFVGDNLFTEGGSGLKAITTDMNPTQRKTVLDYIKSFIEHIKRKLTGQSVASKKIRKLEKMFNETISTVEQKNTTENGDVRYSFNEQNKNTANSGDRYDFEKQIDNINNLPSNEAIVVCGTPKIFLDIGLNNLPMTLNLEHAKDAITLNPEHKDRYIGKATLLDLPNALKKPIAIITSATNKDASLVVIVELKGQKGKNIIAPVYLNGLGTANNIIMDVNAIASVHKRKNALSGLLKNALIDEANGKIGIYYIDNKRTTQIAGLEGLQLPNILANLSGSIHSISEKGSPVNKSFKKVTQTETKQFKKWFGKSKVVDKNGNPRIMYHGTRAENGDFYLFDETKSVKKGGLGLKALGKGNYFTTKKLTGKERYGTRVIEAYLKIENPFVYESGARKSIFEQFQENHGILAENYDQLQELMREN